MEYRPDYATIREAYVTRNVPLPPHLEVPAIRQDLMEVWVAFWELSAGRRYSQLGPQGLAAWEIAAWLDMCGVQGHFNRLWIYRLLMAMDCTWLEWFKARVSRETKQPPKKK